MYTIMENKVLNNMRFNIFEISLQFRGVGCTEDLVRGVNHMRSCDLIRGNYDFTNISIKEIEEICDVINDMYQKDTRIPRVEFLDDKFVLIIEQRNEDIEKLHSLQGSLSYLVNIHIKKQLLPNKFNEWVSATTLKQLKK